jgi:hypothetical protein
MSTLPNVPRSTTVCVRADGAETVPPVLGVVVVAARRESLARRNATHDSTIRLHPAVPDHLGSSGSAFTAHRLSLTTVSAMAIPSNMEDAERSASSGAVARLSDAVPWEQPGSLRHFNWHHDAVRQPASTHTRHNFPRAPQP